LKQQKTSILENFRIRPGDKLETVIKKKHPWSSSYRIIQKSVDARRADVFIQYTVELFQSQNPPEWQNQELPKWDGSTPEISIVGAGPAGLFAALYLTERGVPFKLFERGKNISDRMKDIAAFWKTGVLEPDSNVCFGAGGAGAFSDGKLTTRIRSPWLKWIRQQFFRFGATEDVLYYSNPHIGSNQLRTVIRNLVAYLQEKNPDSIHFEHCVTGFKTDGAQITALITNQGEYSCESVIFAPGHSARDSYRMLHHQKIHMESKAFAVGFRVEHAQKWLDKLQYGRYAGHEDLEPATYRLADHDKNSGVGVYSFCMCPGGHVLKANHEAETICINGMSNYERNSPFCNSAVVISVAPELFGSDYDSGIQFQYQLERAAWLMVAESNPLAIPAQSVTGFLNGRLESLDDFSDTAAISPLLSAPLHKLLPDKLTQRICEGISKFERKMPGFAGKHAKLMGVETRTSAPVRILRQPDTLSSIKYHNFYPCGEGAGYAGGIMSAANDGIRVSEAILENLGK
jgi:uncharacterized FAD-dependent dehydrogenase